MREAYRRQRSIESGWLELEHSKELAAISELLDSQPKIYELAAEDLQGEGRDAKCVSGASGLSAEQVVRALIVKQMNGFSYRQLAFHLADSVTYRTFCRLGGSSWNPKKSALAAGIKSLRPATLEAMHRLVVGTAVETGVDNGSKVRVDATMVESNIHHPTDSELLWDCVRVLTRLQKQAQKVVGTEALAVSDRTRRAKRRRREINSAKRKAQRIKPYRDLLLVTEEVCGGAVKAMDALRVSGATRAGSLIAKLTCYLGRSRRVVDQTRRRILQGESVPASEKLVSIFEEHTDILHKDARETLYGHKVCLTAGRSSLVFDCQVLDGNPADATLAVRMIERHVDAQGKAPRQASFDGGFASKDNLSRIKEAGVNDVVFAKRRGISISEMARSVWVYRSLRNFRAGIEGIISFLKRTFGLRRCTWRTRRSFDCYVWSSVITSNLLVIARHRIANA